MLKPECGGGKGPTARETRFTCAVTSPQNRKGYQGGTPFVCCPFSDFTPRSSWTLRADGGMVIVWSVQGWVRKVPGQVFGALTACRWCDKTWCLFRVVEDRSKGSKPATESWDVSNKTIGPQQRYIFHRVKKTKTAHKGKTDWTL